MDAADAKKMGMIIFALFCSWIIAEYLSTAIARLAGLHGPTLYVASFLLFAVIFLVVMSGLQKALGVFILDNRRLE